MTSDDAIARVIESASRLGVELDTDEANKWIESMAAEAAGGDVVVDVDSGIFGHRASMLDLAPEDMARFQRIAPIVGFENEPGVQTALALSGSSAQSRIHAYPADADFFERIHITADTREEACRILARVVRDKAMATMSAPTHRLSEVKMGTWDADVTKDGKTERAGSPISWSPAEVSAGQMNATTADGEARTVTWHDAAQDPGWVKLDWVVADSTRGQLANASNVIDPTWEAPDGKIVPLDGFLDPYFQEVYLDTDARPVFDRIVKELSADVVDEYVGQLEHEIWKYSVEGPQLGQGRAAAVQRLPPLRQVRRGGLHSRAVRRADHCAVPGGRDHPHAGRGVERGLSVRVGAARGADGPADHVRHRRARWPAGSQGRQPAAPPARPNERPQDEFRA